MEQFDIVGMPLEIFQAGSGRPLVYLHPEHHFEQNLPFLEQLSRQWRVIAPRHPGFDGATPPPEFRSVDDLAYLYLDLLDHMDLQDAVLVGSSFGGWVATEMCVRSCARLSHLVLISSLGIKLGGREDRDFADLFAITEDELRSRLYFDSDRWAPNYQTLNDGQMEAIARDRQYAAYYGWRPYMHNPILGKWLHRVQVPALLIWGGQDGYVPPAHGEALAGHLPRAELSIVAEAGHYPQIEQADQVVDAIGGFTGRQVSPRTTP